VGEIRWQRRRAVHGDRVTLRHAGRRPGRGHKNEGQKSRSESGSVTVRGNPRFGTSI
jgi:hypothetical protein